MDLQPLLSSVQTNGLLSKQLFALKKEYKFLVLTVVNVCVFEGAWAVADVLSEVQVLESTIHF